MKKLILLSTMSAMMALCSMANTNDIAASQHVRPIETQSFKAKAGQFKAAAKASLPAGEHKTYSRSSGYFYILMGVSMSTSDNFASEIVYCDNNEVYIKAPLSDDMMPSDMYMKGTLDNNVITVSFPQDFAVIGDQKYTLNRMEFKVTNPEEQTGLYYKAEDNKITYTIQPDGTVKMEQSRLFSEDIELPDFILGLTDEQGNWVGYGDFDQIYTPFNETIAVIPPDAATQKMMVRYDEYAAKVMDMAIVGDKVYMAGFNAYSPQACIVGDIEGDTVSFKAGQYLGIDDDWNSFAYLWAATYEMGYDEYTGNYGLLIKPISSLDFSYDPVAMTLETDDTLAVNLGNDDLAYIELYGAPHASVYQGDVPAAAPMAPVFDTVKEYNPDPYYEYGNVRFLLPMLDVNGNLLDTSRMHYNFLIDGVPYEFDTDKYIELDQDMTDIPWDFSDMEEYGGYDFKTHNITHIVYFYDPNMKMLDHMGLQQFYRTEDGRTLASDITYYGKPSAVQDLMSEPEAENTEYYNLQGVRMTTPGKGVCIKVSKFNDGTVKAQKVATR